MKTTGVEKLDADALGVAAAEADMSPAVAARIISRYREIVEAVENEPDWRAECHMHGPGWSASIYVADGCQISMTQWSYSSGKTERVYGRRGFSEEGYETFREAVAALAGNSFRSGPAGRAALQSTEGGADGR